MSDIGWPPPPPQDDHLPLASELHAPARAVALLSERLQSRGETIRWARPVQSVYWPGRSCVVRYRARTVVAGRERWLELCARTTHRDLPGEPPRTWSFPDDPFLPDLGPAVEGARVRATLDLPSPAVLSAETLRYRPTRRAVLRYAALRPNGRAHLYGKVLRPDRAQRAERAGQLLSEAGIPAATGTRALPGLIVSDPAPGRSIRELLMGGHRLPRPERIVGMLESLAAVPWNGPAKDRRPGFVARETAALLAHLLPHRRSDISDLGELLGELADGASPGLTVHGDLYDGQIHVAENGRLWLIDLDDAGPGDPLLDAANSLAHLAGLAAATGDLTPLAYRAALRSAFLRSLGGGDADLSWREALCTMRLATGPFRTLDPRWPSLVERRVDRAFRLMRAAVRSAA